LDFFPCSVFVVLPMLCSLRFQLLAPPTFSGDRFSVPPPPPLSVLDYNSLFMLFSFDGGGSVCPEAALDYVPGGEQGVACGA
jgi:hypothetical protein